METSPSFCPFCGSTHTTLIEADAGAWAVSCVSCRAIGPITEGSRRVAVENWNIRLAHAANIGHP